MRRQLAKRWAEQRSPSRSASCSCLFRSRSPARRSSPAPDAHVWELLFGDCGVLDGNFKDLSGSRVRSVPVGTVTEAILGLYTQVAEGSPTSFPPVTSGPLGQLGRQIGYIGGGKRDL